MSPPPSDTEFKSYPLAYLIEGEFPSYFAGKPIPEKPVEDTDSQKSDDGKRQDGKEPQTGTQTKPEVDLSKIEEKGGILSKGRPAKIFLMASSDMLKDNVLDEEGKSPNAVFVLNVLDALNHREGIARMRSKEQQLNPLLETSPFAKTLIRGFNVAGLPVVVVVFGLFMWLRRHARKKQIQRMFQK